MKPHVLTKHACGDNFTNNLEETECEDMDRTHMSQDSVGQDRTQ